MNSLMAKCAYSFLFVCALLCNAYAGTISLPNTFSNGQVIDAGQFNDNFSTIVNEFNGSIDATNISANSITPSELQNTGDFTVGSLTSNGNMSITSTNKFYLDASSDTYIYESSDGVMDFISEDNLTFRITGSKVSVENNAELEADNITATYGVVASTVTASTLTTTSTATLSVANIATIENSPIFSYGLTASTASITSAITVSSITVTDHFNIRKQYKLYLSTNSYITCATHADNMTFLVGGTQSIIYSDPLNAFYPSGDGSTSLGESASNDWGTIYYHTLSQDSDENKKDNIVLVDTSTLNASELPSPKTYQRIISEDPLVLGDTEYGLIAQDCPSEIITLGSDGYYSIDTNSLIAYLCGVIKQQQEQIDALEIRVTALEAQ